MAILNLYGSFITDTTISTACKMSATTGGTEVANQTLNTGAAGAYMEVFSKGGTAVPVSSIPATPTGNGWDYLPGQGTFDAGNWSAAVRMNISPGTDFTLRFFQYSAGVYTLIGSLTTSATTGNAVIVYNFAAAAMAALSFGATDLVYVDLWFQDATGVSGDQVTIKLSDSGTAGVSSDMQVTTTNFTPAPAGPDPVVYGSNVLDSTLTTACKMSLTTGGTETHATITGVGTNPFGEMTPKGNGSTSGFLTIPTTPTGLGWVYQPGAGTIPASNWSASIRLDVPSATNATLRFFKWSSSTYTLIGSIVTSLSVGGIATYTFANTAMPAVIFGASDLLYMDLWFQDATGIAGDVFGVYVSTSSSAGVANDMQVTFPDFPNAALPPPQNPRWHRPRWIMRPVMGGIFTPFQAIPAWVDRAITASFVRPTQPVNIPRYVRRGLTNILVNYGLNISTRFRLGIVKDISTRFILVSGGTQSIRDIAARFRLRSADQLKDIAARFRLMSASQLKDIASRFRLKSADQLKDITTRFRLKSADQFKDIASRFRLKSADQLKDISTRFRLKSANQLKDIATRFRLGKLNDIQGRFRLAILKDISTRFRIKSADQLKDIATRFRLGILKDVQGRFRLAILKDISTRFILAVAGQQLKDIKTRFRLKSADQLKDIASRFRLMSANQLKDIQSRFRIKSADQLKDVSLRFRIMSAAQQKDTQTRLRLRSANQLRDIASRYRLMSAAQLKDISSRFVLTGVGAQRSRDISCRFVLVAISNVTWVTRDGKAIWVTRDDAAKWKARDDSATWGSRDDTAAWNTRDDKATWKTRG